MSILEKFDASALIGLSVVVLHAAERIVETDETGAEEEYIHIPGLDELAAAAAITRCLIPYRLRGAELRAIRKILGLTAKELSDRMGENTAVETISRWESDKSTPGGYTEKLLRIAVCEEIKGRAPGVDYSPQRLLRLTLTDPWREDPDFTMPPMVFERVRLKTGGETSTSWADSQAA
jgi:DNA-binding transcriptional regulator YiaG